MLKPNDYDRITAYGEYNPLELGGHICKIMNVEETTSKSGKPMLIISLDTAPQDVQPGYFSEKYRNDTRQNKKWGCRVWQLVYDSEGNTHRGFKTFCTSVEKSNPNFHIQWGDAFASCFRGALIGGVFGRVEYAKQSGGTGWQTKCVAFRTVEAIENGVEVPEDKYLNQNTSSSAYDSQQHQNDFRTIDDSDDLPF